MFFNRAERSGAPIRGHRRWPAPARRDGDTYRLLCIPSMHLTPSDDFDQPITVWANPGDSLMPCRSMPLVWL